MKKLVFLIFLICNFIYCNSETYSYYPIQNIVKVSACNLTNDGFKINGSTTEKKSNNDSFILDTSSLMFHWVDNKGSSKNSIYNFKSKSTSLNTQYVFNSESNIIRITNNRNNQAVIEVFYKNNN